MMYTIEQSILVIVDVQGSLARAMCDQDALFRNIQTLIQASQHLNIPIIITEQVPEKLGKTIPEVAQYLGNVKPIAKESFSCCGCDDFIAELSIAKREEIILCGIESHVCVYQTVSDLVDRNFPVQVVADAVSSRKKENKDLALQRMRSRGALITSTEMIITELLKTSTHPKFKDILSLIK